MKYNFPKSVLQSEFPNLELKSKHHNKVTFTLKNGQDIVIGNEKKNGDYESDLYEFDKVDDKLVWPIPPDLPNYWAKVDFSKWNGVIDKDARDDFNNNAEQLQKTVNSLVDYETDQRNYFAKLKDTLSDFKTFILKIINYSVATYLHDEVETKYYKKKDVDEKLAYQQAQIDNLTKAISYIPDPNGVFPPSYVGDKDVNDKIYDADTKAEIDKMSAQFKEIDNKEDMDD